MSIPSIFLIVNNGCVCIGFSPLFRPFLCSNVTDVSALSRVHTLILRECTSIQSVSCLTHVHNLDVSWLSVDTTSIPEDVNLIYTYTYVHQICTNAYTRIHVHTHKCVYVYIHVYSCISMYMCVDICLDVDVYVDVNVDAMYVVC